MAHPIREPHDAVRRSTGMIAPASPADWLQGLTMTALLAGVGVTFSRMLGLEEPTPEESTLDVGDDLDASRGSVLVGAVDA
jgi:hypothetical protein